VSFYQFLWRNAAAPLAAGTPAARGISGASGLALWSPASSPRSWSPAFLAAVARSAKAAGYDTTAACWTPSSECLTTRTLARSSEPITSIAADAAGRVFFVEGGRRLAAIGSGLPQPQTVLGAGRDNVRLNQVRLDPWFAASQALYVGETETRPDGSREFRIVRHRLEQNRAVEREVVTALPLPSSTGEGLFALTSTGYVYVALPAAGKGEPSNPGTLLRFHLDGTVPAEQRGSPVIATAYADPTAMAYDDLTGRLWLAGTDAREQPSITSLDEATSALVLPATSLAAAAHAATDYLFATSTGGTLGRVAVGPAGMLTGTAQLAIGSGLVRSVAVDPSGSLLVAVESETALGTTTSLLRLTP
jgi:hypothetical protein